MRIYIYSGGEKLVGRSGVGQAIRHQRECLRRAEIGTTSRWTKDAAAVHVNTILPDSVLAALGAKLRRRKVVWYGHSTMEDFRSSFKGSNVLAPLFKRWITFCYGLGDVVLTPTEYSRRLLEGYGLKKPVYSISNGVDTEFFKPDPAARSALRTRYGLGEEAKVVVSVGHMIARKGLPEFLELARRMAGEAPVDFPRETALGALGLYVSDESISSFQPMNINFGIITPLDHRVKGKRNKNQEISARSLAIIDQLRERIL